MFKTANIYKKKSQFLHLLILRRYLFPTHMVRHPILGKLRMRKRNIKRAVPLDVVPERRSKRCSPRFWPGDRFCGLSFRYLSPGSEEEKCRPLDHVTDPFHSLSNSNFYIYVTVLYRFPSFGTFKCVLVRANFSIAHALLHQHSFQGSEQSVKPWFVTHGTR